MTADTTGGRENQLGGDRIRTPLELRVVNAITILVVMTMYCAVNE